MGKFLPKRKLKKKKPTRELADRTEKEVDVWDQIDFAYSIL